MAIASVGMQSDLARMESISHNTANVLTAGFKRQFAVSAGVPVEVRSNTDTNTLVSFNSPNTTVSLRMLDTSSGALRHTGNSNDVAIEGNAFFEISTPSGAAYTKVGALRTDVQGRLVTLQDAPIMGMGGEIRMANTSFTIAANGDVVQGGQIVGRLKLVQFSNPQALVPNGNGVYQAGEALVQDADKAASLRVGFIEGSNVSSPQEMVRLTETVRHFESLQRVVQGYDETLEKVIRKLGDF